MCGCIGNCILARAPIRPNSAWKALGVIGPFRSVIKTCEDGPCSRCHGQPWPEVSRPVWPQRARQLKSPEPPARGSPRDLAIGIDAGEIDGPVWSVSDRGTAGALD